MDCLHGLPTAWRKNALNLIEAKWDNIYQVMSFTSQPKNASPATYQASIKDIGHYFLALLATLLQKKLYRLLAWHYSTKLNVQKKEGPCCIRLFTLRINVNAVL